MNKLFLTFLTVFTVSTDIAARKLNVANELGSEAQITITYCTGSRITRFLHHNHDLHFTLEKMVQVELTLAKIKKIRLQKMVIETTKEITTITFEDNRIKLPATIVIKKDGVYKGTTKIVEYKERTVLNKTEFQTVAILAAQEAIQEEKTEEIAPAA